MLRAFRTASSREAARRRWPGTPPALRIQRTSIL